jgi:hypothetical protein
MPVWICSRYIRMAERLTFLKNMSCRLAMASPLKSLLMMQSPRGERMKNCPIIARSFDGSYLYLSVCPPCRRPVRATARGLLSNARSTSTRPKAEDTQSRSGTRYHRTDGHLENPLQQCNPTERSSGLCRGREWNVFVAGLSVVNHKISLFGGKK